MKPEPIPPSLDSNGIQKAIRAGVELHRVKLRVLTTAAFVAGISALVGALLIAWCYPIFVLPKLKEMDHEARSLLTQSQTNSAVTATAAAPGSELGKLLAGEILVTNDVITVGTVVMASAVGLLALGTLILLLVVVLNRRVASNQINQSLARISEQLRELQNMRGSI